MTQPIDYVYLCSAPHSGSTLVSCLFSASPSVSTVGEFASDFSPAQKCSCGEAYGRCRFWKDWEMLAKASDIPFQPGKLGINLQPVQGDFLDSLFFYQFSWPWLTRMRDAAMEALWPKKSVEIKAILDRSVQMAQILCKKQRNRIFIDTSKNPFQIRFLSQCLDINLKVIFLVRDGRAVMNSLLSKERVYTPETAIQTWLWCNRVLKDLCATYLNSDAVFFMTLESLCRDPDREIRRLAEFVGVDAQDVQNIEDWPEMHIIGNSMRHSFDGRVRPHDEKWRTQLSSENLSLFESMAGKENRAFGYC